MKAASIWSRLAGLASTPLAPSHYLELVSPLAATHRRQARVEAVHEETADVRTLTLRTGRGWVPHRAGQHIRVQVAVDGRLTTRMYSISSAPGDGRIAITVKAQGRVSRALAALEPGAYLTIGLPEGDFVLPEGDPSHLLFVTGGSGITPIASMVRTLVARGALRDIVHVHFARTPFDEIFGRELRVLAASNPGYRLTIVHTHGDPRRLSAERLDELVPDWRTRETWACGPASMLAAIETCCEGRAHIERFAAALAPLPANDSGGRVRFLASRSEAKSDGRTPLLRVAEDAGVNPPHGCRMGICHSCDATLVAGCVRDLRTGDLAEPGARIQICVCAAAGDVELDL